MHIGVKEFRKEHWKDLLFSCFEGFSRTATSVLLFPIGVLTAIWYFLAVHFDWNLGYAIGMAFVFVRIVIGMLAELMEKHLGKCSPKEGLVNRLVPEICDILYLLALCIAAPSYWAFGAIAISWIVSFLGILPLLVGQPAASLKSIGQPDRLGLLLVFSALHFVFSCPIEYFFVGCLFVGGLIALFRTTQLLS